MNEPRSVYEQASAAFIPAADDDPNAVPFYRAWAGLRAAWGAEFCQQFNSAVHNCACAAGWAQDGQRYVAALAALQSLVDGQKAPEEPRYSYSYRAEPAEPTERDARELFNSQWRAKYPGKRCTSKEANAKYADLADKARAIMRERYTRDMAEYQAAEARTARENETRREEWLDKLHGMALFEDTARGILHLTMGVNP